MSAALPGVALKRAVSRRKGNHKFEEPKRAVLSPADVKKWEQSSAYQDILGFITSMNIAVKGKKTSAPCVTSSLTASLLKMLDTICQWVDDILPIDQPQRYGNKAFRDFYSRLKEQGERILRESLPEEFHPAVAEIAVYLMESFGNSTRIDYGTGHELSFIMFLCCIFKIGALKQEDSAAVVTQIFNRYLSLCRKLQTTYKMEPAGSQGVWSLDDYQFIPFIWGSSQLQMNPKISPEMFCNEKTVNDNADDYMFLSCIKFILSVKTGPFAEHSNQLWNISGVQSWTKINQGLIKMYKAEVLHKFPVVQHVLFGSILSICPATEMVYYPPPGTDMPHLSSKNPTAPSFMTSKPAQGKLPFNDAVSSMSNYGKMPKNLPLNDSLSSVSKMSQGAGSIDHIAINRNSNSITSRSTNISCADERHPAMSPLNPLSVTSFPKCNISTESNTENRK
ncbi:serine/threonine-protein phosphatase 2A activator-like isoform X1 [Portunus trituberculatus]|uniref:serine/threonine-protein phosphatase 2A activator-like isoform X1 n=1 Tax=Portunus trituberculatus TaxID=210409 RepID=UPI001E1D1CB6|nr:serine/threonine-protein phosphatase 2A activator-like isoform X1 [Portunus trituberculatus]XP_045131476.1 serine/threonine-protein phosphatase 2A activator-like isoform X1 [Portunus trituberculatus]